MIECDVATSGSAEVSEASSDQCLSYRKPWWVWMNILSLDAVSVAVFWQLLFARSFHCEIRGAVPAALGASVWVIYLMDHLLDAGTTPSSLEPARKIFFHKHRALMSVVAVCAAIWTFLIAWFRLSDRLFQVGMRFGVIIAMYFAAVHLLPSRIRPLWPREAAVAVLFSVGVSLPLQIEGAIGAWRLMAAVCPFFLLCWLNCCAVEVWEWSAAGRNPNKTPNPVALCLAKHAGLAAAAVVLIVCLVGLQGWLSISIALPATGSAAAFVIVKSLSQAGESLGRVALRCMLLDVALLSPLLAIFLI